MQLHVYVPNVSIQLCWQRSMPRLHSSMSAIKTIGTFHGISIIALSLTIAIESIDGEGVARVAFTVVRAIGVYANLIANVKIFTALIYF